MKRGISIIGVSLALAIAAAAAEPALEFSGVLVENGKPKLALKDKSTGITRWVEPGADYNGYNVAKYVAKEEAVLLRKNGQELRLLMVTPKTPDAAKGPAGVMSAPPAVASAAPPPAQPTPAGSLTVQPPPAGVSTGPATGNTSTAAPMPAASPAASATSTVAAAPAAAASTGMATSPAVEPSPPPLPTAESTATAGTSGLSTMPSGSATGGVSRAVGGGETMESIARSAGLSVPQLKELNPSVNEGSLQPGQLIRIR